MFCASLERKPEYYNRLVCTNERSIRTEFWMSQVYNEHAIALVVGHMPVMCVLLQIQIGSKCSLVTQRWDQVPFIGRQ